MHSILAWSILAQALLTASGADDWQFDYSNHGYDFEKAIPPDGWKGVNQCGVPNNQSPINLMDPLGPYGYIYGTIIPAEVEKLEIAYQDPAPGSVMKFEKKNFFMQVSDLPEGSPPSYISTELIDKIFDYNYSMFTPESFHVHHTTEHKFNGKIYDTAMHTNHRISSSGADTGSDMFTLSFSFSVDNFDRSISEEERIIINNFFDDLNLENRTDNSEAKEIGVESLRFREVMDVFDYSHRWTYLGGAAFPPCNQINFWQVLCAVYPIKLEHAEMIQRTFESKQEELGALMNNRGIYPVNGHRVRTVLGRSVRLKLNLLLAVAFAILISY